MARVTRHGVPAAVSAMLGSAAGLLGNAFSNGWAWPVGLAFGAAVLAEAAWLGFRAVREHRQGTAHTDGTEAMQVNTVGKVSSRSGQAVGINYGDVRQEQRR